MYITYVHKLLRAYMLCSTIKSLRVHTWHMQTSTSFNMKRRKRKRYLHFISPGVQPFQQICALPIRGLALHFHKNQAKKEIGPNSSSLTTKCAKHNTLQKVRAIFNFSFIVEILTESHSQKYHLEGSVPAEKGN